MLRNRSKSMVVCRQTIAMSMNNTQFGHADSIHGQNLADYLFRTFEIASEKFSSDYVGEHDENEKKKRQVPIILNLFIYLNFKINRSKLVKRL